MQALQNLADADCRPYNDKNTNFNKSCQLIMEPEEGLKK
jgi:hypothetical protein